jgi:phosphoadenosine phosphosulfate reductase
MSQTGNAIDTIRKYEDKKGYFVAFSGGKDSIVMYDLVKRADVAFQVYFSFTTIDPPELILFIKQFYPEVNFLRPKKSMYRLIIDRGLPTRVTRFCCQALKEYSGAGQIVVTGIRAQESRKRSQRKLFEKDNRYKKWYLNPILKWSESDVWSYIHSNKLPYPTLYDCGLKRIGCIGCPMAYYKTRQKELNRYPQYIKMYKQAIRKRMDKGFFSEFKDEHDVYSWWVGNLSMKDYLAQYRIPYS